VSGTSKALLFGANDLAAMILGVVTGTGGVCLGLRLIAAWQHWGLPRAGAL
jgi:uncharacterized membrane protein YeiH